MIIENKQITLKDGRAAILKTPEVGDGAKMLHYITTACGETEFLVRYPEEWEGVTIESEENWIRNGRESADILRISCYVDGEIAGNCEIAFRSGIKIRHRATIGIAILKKYWGLGIGSAMFDAMIAAAMAHDGTELIDLEFIEGNARARALYEKFGFRIVAVRPNAFKLKDGRSVNEYLMQKELCKA
ncbi:MAG: GNAT family N-acetyltransferase [Clostridia bacterium]|nr:GNAT family N-acetyltransferase [Clostridia bacterium]